VCAEIEGCRTAWGEETENAFSEVNGKSKDDASGPDSRRNHTDFSRFRLVKARKTRPTRRDKSIIPLDSSAKSAIASRALRVNVCFKMGVKRLL